MKKTFLLLSVALLSLASCSSDDNSTAAPVVEVPSTGEILQPTVGGPNQPNHVFVDLSAEGSTAVRRDSWDFGFATGSEFRVILNGSIKMAAKKLETSDITLPQTADENVGVGQGTFPASNGYVDNPTGIFTGTGAGEGSAIAEISATDADNKVYLVNLGHAISTEVPGNGSAATDGASRGWRKVRVLRSGNGYKIQYAALDATTFTEKTVEKNADFNYVFFNLTTGTTASVEPQKLRWDLNFTTFTNYLPGTTVVTYGYADFITTNVKGGTKAYQVLTADGGTYENFSRTSVVENNFTVSATDQRAIGANWRAGGGPGSLPSIRTDRFYVIKDVAGNYYKIKFLAMTNPAGERGNPTFEYALLQ